MPYPSRYESIRAFWISIFSVVFSLLLFSFYTIDKIKYVAINYQNADNQSSKLIDTIVHSISIADIIILFVLAISAILNIYLGFFKNLYSRLLSSEKSVVVLLLLLLVWLGHSYLIPGYLLGGDIGAHVAALSHKVKGLGLGRIITWDNYWFLGSPVTISYSPTTMWPVAFLGFLTGNVTAAVKLLLFAAHISSGWVQYRFLRALRMAPAAGLLGALIYAGSFAHLHQLHYRGTISLALMFTALPLALWMIVRILRDRRQFGFDWTVLALTGGFLLVNYLPAGIVAGVFLAFFTLIYTFIEGVSLRRVIPVITAGILAVAMAAFVVLIALNPSPYGIFETFDIAPGFHWPTWETVSKLVTWGNSRTNWMEESAAYVGLTTLLLAAVGILASAKPGRFEIRKTTWLLIAFTAAALTFEFQFVRNILFVLLFLSALAAAGASRLLNAGSRWRWLGGALLLAVMADLSVTAIQPVARTDKAFLATAGQFLAETDDVHRVIQTSTWSGDLSFDYGSGSGPTSYAGIEEVVGGYNGMATIAHNYALAVVALAEDDLATDKALSPETERVLCMFRVSHIVNNGSREMGLPASISMATELGPLGRVVINRCGYQIVVSGQLVEEASREDFDHPLLWAHQFHGKRSETIDQLVDFVRDLPAVYGLSEDGRADRIPVRASAATGTRLPAFDRIPKIRVIDYEVEVDRITVRLNADAPGYVRLAHAYHPELRVRRNGEYIAALPSLENMIVVPIQQGENVLEIGREVPTRIKLSIYLSLAAVLLALLLGYLGRRRARPEN